MISAFPNSRVHILLGVQEAGKHSALPNGQKLHRVDNRPSAEAFGVRIHPGFNRTSPSRILLRVSEYV